MTVNMIIVRKRVYVVDNGDRPFGVQLSHVGRGSGIARIGHRRNRGEEMVGMRDNGRSYRLWREIAYEGAWVGRDPCERLPLRMRCPRSWWHGGNAVLLQTGQGQFTFIGDTIFAFMTQPADTIVEFWSPMGDSAVPYSYAVGKTHTYLLVVQKVVTNKALQAWRRDRAVSSTRTNPYDARPVRRARMRGLKLLHARET
jgi:hypothetical protein